jgi:copper(I)-binding protein
MKKTLLAAALVALSLNAWADVQVKEPWVRNAKPPQTATGVFGQFTTTEDATLVSAASPVAGSVMLMKAQDGKMSNVAKLDVPAGKGLTLAPGSDHIMLMDLKQGLKKGDTVPVTLTLEGKNKKVQTLVLNAEVR